MTRKPRQSSFGKRRKFLKTAGAFAVASAAAGCSGSGGGGGGNGGGGGGGGNNTTSSSLKTFKNDAGVKVGQNFEAVKELAKEEKETTVYATIDRGPFSTWIKEFNKKYPEAKINHVTGGSEKLISRWTTEYETGRMKASMFISTSNVKRTWQNGQVMKLKPEYMPSFREAPDKFKSDDGSWLATRQVLGSVFYNTNQVKKGAASSWMDVVNNQKWSGQKIGWDPTPNMFLMQWLFENQDKKFFQALHDMKPRWVDSHTDLVRLCGAGEFPVAFSYTHKMGRFGKKLPIDYFKFDPMPSVVSPGVISNRAASPNSALLFFNWLASKEGQMVLGKTQYIPWHPDAEYTAYDGVYPSNEYKVDTVSPAVNIEQTNKQWKNIMGDLISGSDTD